MTAATHRDWFGLDRFRPGPRFVRDGARCFLLEEVGSTSDFLLGRGEPATGRICEWDGWGWRAQPLRNLRAVGEARLGTVVVARRQTAGRGRQGRGWTDCGGLHMSCVVPNHRADFELGFSVWLGLMVVLALRDDCGLDARLMWPNDVMVRERKIGGILVDSIGHGAKSCVVAGLGLNLSTAPEGFPPSLQGRATSILIETGHVMRPGDIASLVLRRVEAELDRFGSEGWHPFQQALTCCDCLLGQEVTVHRAGRTRTGRAAGFDDRGALRLITVDGRIHRYHAGDVHLEPSDGGVTTPLLPTSPPGQARAQD